MVRKLLRKRVRLTPLSMNHILHEQCALPDALYALQSARRGASQTAAKVQTAVRDEQHCHRILYIRILITVLSAFKLSLVLASSRFFRIFSNPLYTKTRIRRGWLHVNSEKFLHVFWRKFCLTGYIIYGMINIRIRYDRQNLS